MIKNIEQELNIEIKRWTIYDAITNKFYDISDKAFSEGLTSNFIKLRGQFVEVENKHKIWIDGIVK